MTTFDPATGACDSVYAACAYLHRALDDSVGKSGEQLCCVFDIDDTLLVDQNGNLGRNQPVCDLLHRCLRVGVRVHIVTARPESARAATRRDLDLDVTPGYTSLQMLPPAVPRESIGMWKFIARWHCTMNDAGAGAPTRMIFAIGDQWWDLLRDDEQIEHAVKIFPSPDIPYIITACPPMEPASILVKLPHRS